MNLEKTTQEKAGSCYGCPSWPGGDYKKCDEGYNIKRMQSKNCPCYGHISSVLNTANVKDNSDNIKKENSN